MKHLTLWLVLLISSLAWSRAADWAGWRGPGGLGVSPEKSLPSEWSAEQNLAWQMAPPGKGASSPVVVGNRIYLTTQTSDDKLHVLAIDRMQGTLIWDRSVGQGRGKSHDLINMAAPTAVADDRHVWALFGTGDLVCLDKNGKLVWNRNLPENLGDYHYQWGMGTSPMMVDAKVVVACMHQGPSYLVAIETLTGKTSWKTDRNLLSDGEARDAYSSPIIVPAKDGPQIVLSGANHLNAYHPRDGRQLWISGGLEVPHPYGRAIAGPAAGGNTIVTVASGFQNRGHLMAVNNQGLGDVTESRQLWTAKRYAPDCPSPVVYQGLVYMIRDDGIASCLDLKTGQPHWQERLFKANVKVSPVAGAGRVYFTSSQGSTIAVKAGPALDIISTNNLNEPTLSTPALSHGRIYIRTDKHLYAIKGS